MFTRHAYDLINKFRYVGFINYVDLFYSGKKINIFVHYNIIKYPNSFQYLNYGNLYRIKLRFEILLQYNYYLNNSIINWIIIEYWTRHETEKGDGWCFFVHNLKFWKYLLQMVRRKKNKTKNLYDKVDKEYIIRTRLCSVRKRTRRYKCYTMILSRIFSIDPGKNTKSTSLHIKYMITDKE